jgi:hypothetical protein
MALNRITKPKTLLDLEMQYQRTIMRQRQTLAADLEWIKATMTKEFITAEEANNLRGLIEFAIEQKTNHLEHCETFTNEGGEVRCMQHAVTVAFDSKQAEAHVAWYNEHIAVKGE